MIPSALEYISKYFPYNLVDYTMPLVVRRPLKREGWNQRLIHHPDRFYVNMILDIIEFGAKIGYQGPPQQILSENLSSATDSPDIISRDLDNQINHDRVTRIDILPTQFILSPLGLVRKPNGGWRRIYHLTHPRGSSVNCIIQEEFGMLEYTIFDDSMEMLLKVGPGAIFVKRDLADAFRHIPVSASDWWLLEFLWHGYY